MEQTNFQSERSSKPNSKVLLVSLLGFKASDQDAFRRFFQTNRLNQRNYLLADQAEYLQSDILLVNFDIPSALLEKDKILFYRPNIQVVAVSRGLLENPPIYHIRGMLFAARVLQVLDKIVINSFPDAEPVHSALVDISNQQNQKKEIRTVSSVILDQPTGAVFVEPLDILGYCALVVDDSLAIQKSLEINLQALTQINLIDFADNGETAIQKAEERRYDLIFLDVMMPGIDGYETCMRLRSKPAYKKTPIIMVSGKTSPLDEVKGVMAGCTTYLTKPVEQEAFRKLSNRVLSWLDRQKTLIDNKL